MSRTLLYDNHPKSLRRGDLVKFQDDNGKWLEGATLRKSPHCNVNVEVLTTEFDIYIVHNCALYPQGRATIALKDK